MAWGRHWIRWLATRSFGPSAQSSHPDQIVTGNPLTSALEVEYGDAAPVPLTFHPIPVDVAPLERAPPSDDSGLSHLAVPSDEAIKAVGLRRSTCLWRQVGIPCKPKSPILGRNDARCTGCHGIRRTRATRCHQACAVAFCPLSAVPVAEPLGDGSGTTSTYWQTASSGSSASAS